MENKNINTYTVYKHIFPNGKIYIGITSLNPKMRWEHNGEGYKRQALIYNAILKYGWKNIKHEILYTDLSKKDAEKKEFELIKAFNSNNKKFGYNIDNGGNVGKHTEETKLKIKNSNIGKTRSNETKLKISIAKKGYKHTEEWKIQNSIRMKGRKLSKEAKQNISKAKMGNKNPNFGKKLSMETLAKRLESPFYKKVAQCHLDGNIIKIFKRINVASKETGICAENICRVCNNKRKTAGGYKWIFVI